MRGALKEGVGTLLDLGEHVFQLALGDVETLGKPRLVRCLGDDHARRARIDKRRAYRRAYLRDSVSADNGQADRVRRRCVAVDIAHFKRPLGDRSRCRIHSLADKRRAKTLVRKQHVGVGVARLDGRHLAVFVKQNFHVRVDIHQQIAAFALLGNGLEQRRHHDRKHDRDHKHGGDRRDRDREPYLAPRRASPLCAALGRRADGRIRDPLTHLGRNAFELVFEPSFEIFVVHRSSSFIYLRNFLSALLYFHVTVPSG